MAQSPNQWLLSEDHILDFSQSPPTLIDLPDTVVRDAPIEEDVVFEMIASTPSGMLDYFTMGWVRIRRKIHFFKSNFSDQSFGANFQTSGRGSGVYSLTSNLPFTQIAFPNGNNFTPVFLGNSESQMERIGLLKIKRETSDSLFMDSVATRQDRSSTFHRLVHFTDTSFLYLSIDTGKTKQALVLRILHVSQSGTVIEDIKTDKGEYQARNFIAANRTPFFALSERDNDELGAFLRLKFFKIQSNLSVQKVNETIVRSLNQREIAFHDGAFSPNDSLFYFSYRDLYDEQFINGNVLARVDIFGSQNLKVIPHRDSMFIESMGCAPNGQLYFVHRHRDEYPRTWLGAIQYPDQKNLDKIGIEVKKHQGYSNRGGYPFGLAAKKYINVPLLRYKVRQSHCRNDYLTCSNWSDKEYVAFEWELFDLDTNLVSIATGKVAKLYPQESGSYLVRLRGTDQFGKNSWRWQEVDFQKPYTFDFTIQHDTACLWTDVTMTAKVQSESHDNVRYYWSFYRNDTPSFRDTGKILTTQFKQSGVYNVTLKVNVDGCLDTAGKKRQIILIDAPQPGFHLSNDSLCTPHSVTVTDESQGRITSVEYIWSDGNRYTERNGHSRTFLHRGDYSLVQILKGPTGCQTQDSTSLHVMQGVSDSIPTLLLATVQDHKSVQIKWKPVLHGEGYQLKRMSDGTIYNILGDTMESFVDVLADSIGQSYEYRLQAMDSCQQKSRESNLGKTIFLSVVNQNNAYTVLTWNAYGDWPQGVDEYTIESSFDGVNWSAIEGLKGLSYTDSRRTLLDNDQVFYRIKASKKDDVDMLSISNVVRVNTSTTLFIPNAFTPNGDGTNDFFTVGTYGINTFRCQLFSRSGQMILQTDNPQNIWDGTSTIGEDYPLGAYTYIIQVEDVKGNSFQETGYVVLIR